MIAWLFTNGLSQLAYLAGTVWFLNGVRKALFKPRLKVVSVSKTAAGTFVEVHRQQLLPPWLTFKETWMRDHGDFLRENDGVKLSSDRFGPVYLNRQLSSLLEIHAAREKELQELLREEKRAL